MLFKQFKRIFSRTLHKDQMILTGKMDFAKDFINDTRGDLYPVIAASGDCHEEIKENSWQISAGETERMFCRFFPFLTCEITSSIKDRGCAGLGYHIAGKVFRITMTGPAVVFTSAGGSEQQLALPPGSPDRRNWLVSCRPGFFDVYLRNNGKAELIGTFDAPDTLNSRNYEIFSGSFVTVYGKGAVTFTQVSAGIDNGVSTADIRTIRYEDGTPLMENGRIFLSVSIRIEKDAYQGIYSWVPGTADLDLTGVLFYDAGDGMWANDISASILYHREKKQWLIWVCSFSRGHILGYGNCQGDPRYGVNVVDITLMPPITQNDPHTAFLGKKGDEDPDFIYDPATKKWSMAICRLDPESNQYRYYFYESDHPFSGYHYTGRGAAGAETGGSFVTINKERCFICGNSFTERSDYRIYRENGMEKADFNFPDGGFRGWGTVIPVHQGSRCRYYWLTFDRHNGSQYNWSYGNIYCFEADLQ